MPQILEANTLKLYDNPTAKLKIFRKIFAFINEAAEDTYKILHQIELKEAVLDNFLSSIKKTPVKFPLLL